MHPAAEVIFWVNVAAFAVALLLAERPRRERRRVDVAPGTYRARMLGLLLLFAAAFSALGLIVAFPLWWTGREAAGDVAFMLLMGAAPWVAWIADDSWFTKSARDARPRSARAR